MSPVAMTKLGAATRMTCTVLLALVVGSCSASGHLYYELAGPPSVPEVILDSLVHAMAGLLGGVLGGRRWRLGLLACWGSGLVAAWSVLQAGKLETIALATLLVLVLAAFTWLGGLPASSRPA